MNKKYGVIFTLLVIAFILNLIGIGLFIASAVLLYSKLITQAMHESPKKKLRHTKAWDTGFSLDTQVYIQQVYDNRPAEHDLCNLKLCAHYHGNRNCECILQS